MLRCPDAIRELGHLWPTVLQPHFVIRLADEFFEVFAAKSGKERAVQLDALLSSSPRPHLEDNGYQHCVSWETEDLRTAAEAAWGLSLVNLLVEDERSRAAVGMCQASNCEDVYIDRSRARSRRFCSTTCHTRKKVAAFRARHRGEPA